MSDRPAGRARARLALAVLACAAAAVTVGCSQEGKLIQTPLPVHAVAADFQVTGVTDTTHTLNVRFKISVHVRNACEAQHALLQLQRIDGTPTVYRITPVARYAADDRCVQGTLGEVDTVITLNVNGLFLGRISPTQIVNDIPFQIVSTGADPILFDVDTLVTVTGADSAGFLVRVEHANADSVPGATVAIDRLDAGGVATPLDSVLTGSSGLARLTFPVTVTSLADTVDVPILPYRVRVTAGASSEILSVPTFPARLWRREKIVVRL